MWWLDVLIVVVIIAGIYAFVVIVRARTSRLSSQTDRTAEQMYDEFADPLRTQRRFARRHGGTWRDSG
jgi:hypothetical protein